MYDLLSRGSFSSRCLMDENGRTLSYRDVHDEVDRIAEKIASFARPAVVFLYAANSSECILAYLACLKAAVPVCLCEANDKSFERLVSKYRPSGLLLPTGIKNPVSYREGFSIARNFRVLVRENEQPFDYDVNPDLAVLLPTSGSTGNSKLVKLTKANLVNNAKSIVQYLGLTPKERPILSLPIQYSYGLSVLNSHLYVGAFCHITRHSFIRPEFWIQFSERKCTSFAGVPYVYETLNRLHWDPAGITTLRSFTQAGGGLKRELISHFCDKAIASGTKFYVMYGQTEATARISYVPPEMLKDKIGSIGIAIPGGKMRLEPALMQSEDSELVYEGRNVMMGYAEGPDDLARGDELNGVLRTGDIAEMDEDGYFFLKGRLNRFAKLFGKRINLKDIEDLVEDSFPCRVIAVEGGNGINIFAELGSPDAANIRKFIAEYLEVTPTAIKVQNIEKIPMTASGKKDYKGIK